MSNYDKNKKMLLESAISLAEIVLREYRKFLVLKGLK